MKDWKELAMEFEASATESKDRKKTAIRENISSVVVYAEEVMTKEED